jgi:hypothetical protein
MKKAELQSKGELEQECEEELRLRSKGMEREMKHCGHLRMGLPRKKEEENEKEEKEEEREEKKEKE